MSNKIGIYEFELLQLNEKADYLWENGTFLANRTDSELKIQLHVVGDFYVEVLYDKKKNCIIGFRTFKSIRLLDPYLDALSIDNLLM